MQPQSSHITCSSNHPANPAQLAVEKVELNQTQLRPNAKVLISLPALPRLHQDKAEIGDPPMKDMGVKQKAA